MGFVIKEAREAQVLVHVRAVCADMAKVLLLTPRRCLKEEVGARGIRLDTARWSTCWMAGFPRLMRASAPRPPTLRLTGVRVRFNCTFESASITLYLCYRVVDR